MLDWLNKTAEIMLRHGCQKILAGVQTLPECMRRYMTGMEGGRRVTIGALENITAPKQLE